MTFSTLRSIAVLLAGASLATAQGLSVAITVDDLPIVGPNDAALAEQVNRAIVDSLVRHRVRATAFNIERKLQQIGAEPGRKILQHWLDRGQDLGNHTFSHPDLNKLTPQEFMREVTDGEATFRPLLRARGDDRLYLRFPFNHTGDTPEKRKAVRDQLEKRGYRIAVCTIHADDWQYARAYNLMLDRNDQSAAARLRKEYLAHTAAAIDYYAAMHRKLFGRDTGHVMLIHANRLNADTMDQVLALFKERQFRFVTLEEAQSDPVYATPEGEPTSGGPMWAYRWAKAKGVAIDGSAEPEVPSWVIAYGN